MAQIILIAVKFVNVSDEPPKVKTRLNLDVMNLTKRPSKPNHAYV